MKDYIIQLIIEGQLMYEGIGTGSNAFEAFENGVQNGTVNMPHGTQVTVVALNEHGLAVSFEASRV